MTSSISPVYCAHGARTRSTACSRVRIYTTYRASFTSLGTTNNTSYRVLQRKPTERRFYGNSTLSTVNLHIHAFETTRRTHTISNLAVQRRTREEVTDTASGSVT